MLLKDIIFFGRICATTTRHGIGHEFHLETFGCCLAELWLPEVRPGCNWRLYSAACESEKRFIFLLSKLFYRIERTSL
jgi:hypothetical protein